MHTEKQTQNIDQNTHKTHTKIQTKKLKHKSTEKTNTEPQTQHTQKAH